MTICSWDSIYGLLNKYFCRKSADGILDCRKNAEYLQKKCRFFADGILDCRKTAEKMQIFCSSNPCWYTGICEKSALFLHFTLCFCRKSADLASGPPRPGPTTAVIRQRSKPFRSLFPQLKGPREKGRRSRLTCALARGELLKSVTAHDCLTTDMALAWGFGVMLHITRSLSPMTCAFELQSSTQN